jgi:hypothetical protein
MTGQESDALDETHLLAGLCRLHDDVDHTVRHFLKTLEQCPALNHTRAKLDSDLKTVRADSRMAVLPTADLAQTSPGRELSLLGVVF